MNIKLLRSYLSSPTFEQKLNHRLLRLQQAETNPIERMNILVDCSEDFFVFVDLFGVVYEPRLSESPDIPLFLFPHQREAITRILDAENNAHDLLIEKTRDMMMTWTVLWYILWKWRFKDKWYGLVGSRKEEEVDDKSPQSLFGRLRYMLYSLPQWMRPQNFRKSEHDIHMKLINPEKQAYVDGESANTEFARGSRASFIFLDELFFWKFARESWRACVDSSPCRIAVSTAKPSSFARQLRESMERNNWLLTLDWKMNPFKDEEWFQNELKRRDSDALSVVGELEISYVSDPTRSYYPEVSSCKTEEFDYAPNLPLYVSLDFGSQDKTAIVYWQRNSTNFLCLDGMEKRNKPLSWYYPFLKQGYTFLEQDEYIIVNKFTKENMTIRKRDYLSTELELIRRFNTWKAPIMYAGEPAHKMKQMKSNTSIATELAAIGIFLRVNDQAIQHPIRRTSTKTMLKTTIFSLKYGALDVFDALLNSVYPNQRDNSSNSDRLDKPVHDEFADLRSAVENFAVNIQLGGTKIREFAYRH